MTPYFRQQYPASLKVAGGNRLPVHRLHVRKASRAEAGQRAIYDALGIDASPGGIRKLIIEPDS